MRVINEAWAMLSDPIRRGECRPFHGRNGWAERPLGRLAIADTAGPPSSTRTWATWRATAADTQAAPRTVRQPGEVPIPRTRRPPRAQPVPETFRDSGLAAFLAGVLILALLLGAIIVGRLAL